MNAKLEHGAAEAAKVLISYRNSDSIRQACSVSLQRMKLCISKHARKAMTELSGEDHGFFEISFWCWYTSSFQGLGLASKFMKRWSCCLNVNLDVFHSARCDVSSKFKPQAIFGQRCCRTFILFHSNTESICFHNSISRNNPAPNRGKLTSMLLKKEGNWIGRKY